MRTAQFIIMPSSDITTVVNSAPIQLNQIFGFAVQAIYAGSSPNGTLKLQASCDLGSDQIGTNVTNWSDITGSSFAVTGNGSYLWDVDAVYFLWARMVWTFNSGTGLLSANASIKGF